MPNNRDRHLPKKLIQGKTPRSQEAHPPTEASGGGRIDTKAQWANVKWTPKKLGLVIPFLSIPYLLVIFSIFKTGNTLVAGIMIALVVLIGLLFLLLRWIEQADF